ncbi:unnamed protein product [Adineta ricciae]|uniref:Uncharacterized protein n=1 Tax=Adineta ricciae TaxID=249248 RepID=A0A816F2A7_ADIRI|nr:unnamed protein product [Adineta ricciae]CAF1655548.1 unnamed protein product [Adineta ricciae]
MNSHITMLGTQCHGLALDKDGALYVIDQWHHFVKRWSQREKDDKIIAGINDYGTGLYQLKTPILALVDENFTHYISDSVNNRAMKCLNDVIEHTSFDGVNNGS